MDRRELLEGLIFLMFGRKKKPAAATVVAPVLPVRLPDGSRVRYALAERQRGEWALYAVKEDGQVEVERKVMEVRVPFDEVQAP